MKRIVISATLTLAVVSPFAGRTQDLPEHLNRFSFGPMLGLNFKAGFYNNNSINPGPAAGVANHTYDDGYVRVDSSGDAGGLTGNWGYRNASQFNASADAMQFHDLQTGASSATDDPQFGGEIIYQRVLGTLPIMHGDWGLETGFGYTKIDIRQNLSGTAPVITDSFPLNGVIPPGAGYQGTAQGPGALLGDTPSRSVTSATLAGYERLSGQSFNLRLGPFAEWYFTSKISLAASAGLTLAPTTIDYDFSETALLAGGGTLVAGGHSSTTKLLYGPYVGGMLSYDFNDGWGVFVGARFQNLNGITQSIGDHTARLGQGATLYATAGISWRF